MLENLKKQVYKTNMELVQHNLVLFTWGNVSAIDRETNLIAIKPSGVDYDKLSAENMVIVDLNGKVVEGELSPSSDLQTHLALYKAFPNIGGVVHTHSHYATVMAQLGQDILPYGTTHADYFYGSIPCTRNMSREEIINNYELETGNVIVETFNKNKINPDEIPAVLVKNHGPFTWGKDADEAVYHAVVLEELAKMAYQMECYNSGKLNPMPQDLLDKHFLRKHGKNAYYGQKTK